MKKILMTVLLLVVANNVLAVPTFTEASATGTTVKFATKLSEKLPTGYKVKIDLNNGKGFVAMACSGLACSLSSNALSKNTDSLTYKIGIYDAKGALQGETKVGNYVIISTATAEYTKISNSGIELPDTALFGSAQNNWACTKDNKTGLIWEVKTADGGFRDMNKNYIPDIYSDSKNTNLDVFVQTVNQQTLCGAANWRLPTVTELKTLIYCSDGRYTDGYCTYPNDVSKPSINKTFFPNSSSFGYWAWSPEKLRGAVWFGDADKYTNINWGTFVRLVR